MDSLNNSKRFTSDGNADYNALHNITLVIFYPNIITAVLRYFCNVLPQTLFIIQKRYNM